VPSEVQCWQSSKGESYAVFVDGKEVAKESCDKSVAQGSIGKEFTIDFTDTKPRAIRLEYTHESPNFGAGMTLAWKPVAAALQAEAVKVAEQADVVVAFIGLSPDLEGEEMPIKIPGFAGGDRTDLKLPAEQQAMLEAVAKTGKPLVVVLMNGSALAVNWSQNHAGAILEAWYPGEAGGTAIADTLFGKNNPAGRLPLTFYASISQLPAFDDYSMKGRTYRYSTATPLYKFGYGLSYTHFTTSAKLASAKIAAGEPLVVHAKVANAGEVAGDEVVEVYLTPPASETAPIRALVGFERVHVLAGESKDVSITINPRQLSQVDAQGKRAILPGTYGLYVGGAQPEAGAKGATFEITGKMMELPE
jgi:beta-glucosidase